MKQFISTTSQVAHRQHPSDLSFSYIPHSSPPSSETARVKIRSLLDQRSKGQAVCFRCGDHGHLASSCRNSIVCFSGGQLGHKSHQCHATTMFQPPPPKPSPQALAQANSLPVIKFYPNPANKKFCATIQNSLILHDKLELGPIYIQTHLHKLFLIPDWSWVARALPRNKYLVEPPNADWRQMILSQGEVVLVMLVLSLNLMILESLMVVLIQLVFGLT
jgi:Zinc knuckle